MRLAVVGHVEWVEFVEVDRVPAPGQIAHGTDSWSEPAGGGAVVAAQIKKLNGTCTFHTSLGEDDLGRRSAERLAELGLDLNVQWTGTTRRALVHVDRDRERTITTVGPKLLPAGPLPLEEFEGVFFVAGDVAALHSARRGRFLAATPRELVTLRSGGVRLDLLVGSARDPGEAYDGSLEVDTICLTEGSHGGVADGARFDAAPLPAPLVDTYGAGDSFSAALFFALTRGDSLKDALGLASRAGAAVVTGKGPYTAQISA